jgi:hypothetical protein
LDFDGFHKFSTRPTGCCTLDTISVRLETAKIAEHNNSPAKREITKIAVLDLCSGGRINANLRNVDFPYLPMVDICANSESIVMG